jgi:hypothetical protein
MLGRVSDEVPANDTIAGIVGHGQEGGRIFGLLVWGGVAMICIGFTATLILPHIFPPSLQVRAAKLLTLPSDATVVKVSDGNPPYGSVIFRLPAKSLKGSRIDEVWKLNGWPGPFTITSSIASRAFVGKLSRGKFKRVKLVKGKLTSTPLGTGKKSPVRPISTPIINPYSFLLDPGTRISLNYDLGTKTYHFSKTP